MGEKILAYDLGTGGSKASLYDLRGMCEASAFVPYDTLYTDTGWHEQRPDDWWKAIVESTRRLLIRKPSIAPEIEALAISGHSLGVVPVDASGGLLRSATPIWSDSRSKKQAQAFFGRIDPERWYLRTGNGFPAECYSIFKIMWYRDNEPAMFGRTRAVLGTKDYINLRLTGEMRTDFSYASGCGAYDLIEGGYAREFIRASGLSETLFPDIVPSTRVLGTLTKEASETLGLPRTVKVVCGGVDNSCMALGARNTRAGRVYTSLGSSAWIAVSSEKPVLDAGLKPYVFAHVIPGLFTSAVSIFAGGSSFRWIRDALLPPAAGGRDPYEVMNEMAARSPLGANKLIFNPSLAGGSSQEPSPRIRGCFAGLDLRHTRDDMVRAGMEGIAMNLAAVLEILRGFVKLEGDMLMVGGGSKSRLWRQIFADLFAMDILKTNVDQDAAALGAAALAAVGCGLWKDFAPLEDAHTVESVEKPIEANAAAYRRLMPVFVLTRKQCAELGDLLHGIEI